jgi:hypothetical protein
MNNFPNIFLVTLAAIVLTACDFTVSLSEKPEMRIDENATGLWQRTKPDGDTESLLILPLDEYEYFISWPEGAKTELYARAHLFELTGMTLVQLQWFGNSDGDIPDDDRNYQYADYTIKATTLTIRLLNADIIGRDFHSADELAQAIVAERDNPELYRDALTFRKM